MKAPLWLNAAEACVEGTSTAPGISHPASALPLKTLTGTIKHGNFVESIAAALQSIS